MWRVEFSAVGEPGEVVHLVQVPPPGPPGEHDVIVRVQAFPINPSDLLTVTGRYANVPALPAPMGAEAVGVVEAIGAHVSRVGLGDTVVFLGRDNWSELRGAAETEVVKVSERADPLQLSMLKVNPATAHLLLTRFANLAPGDWIIQNAGGSAVARYVAQLARQRGVKVVSVVRRSPCMNTADELFILDGPDLADRVRSATGGAACELALDAVGGEATQRLADCLAEGRRIVVYGGLDGSACALRPDQAIFRDLQLCGFWLTRHVQAAPQEELDSLYAHLSNMVADGTLAAEIAAVYALADLRDALSHAGREARNGKVLVVV